MNMYGVNIPAKITNSACQNENAAVSKKLTKRKYHTPNSSNHKVYVKNALDVHPRPLLDAMVSVTRHGDYCNKARGEAYATQYSQRLFEPHSS